ncbi:MAG: hypothetical protein H7Z14_11920, partial [Anaerolineae bacterium]|nr:hypothetical protein [Phycisphaerae bacterium]
MGKQRYVRRCRAFTLAIAASAVGAGWSRAAIYTWIGSNPNWRTSGNWLGPTGPTGFPGVADTAFFNTSPFVPFINATPPFPPISTLGLTLNPGVNVNFNSFLYTVSGTAQIDGNLGLNQMPGFAPASLIVGTSGNGNVTATNSTINATNIQLGGGGPLVGGGLQLQQSNLNVANNVYLGGTSTTGSGTGTLTVDSSTASIIGTLKFYSGGRVNLNSSVSSPALTVGAFDETNAAVLDAITFNAGTITATSGGLGMGFGRALQSTLTLDAISPGVPRKAIRLTNDTNGAFTVATGGNLTINGGILDVASITKSAGAVVNWGASGGTLSVRNGGVVIDATTGLFTSSSISIPAASKITVGQDLKIGQTGASQIALATSASFLDVKGKLIVGDSAAGVLNLPAGVAQLTAPAAQLQIGAQVGSSGTVLINGGQLLGAGNAVYVGGTDAAAGGAGTLTISSGTFNTSNGSAGSALTIYNTGTVILGGGTLSVPNLDIRTGGRFTFSAGTLAITNSAGLTVDSIDAGAGSTFNIAGPTSWATIAAATRVGSSGAGTLTLSNGATLVNNGASASAIGVNASGSGTVSVGTGVGVANWTLSGPLEVGQSGTAQLFINRGGKITAPSLTVASVSGSNGSVTIGQTSGAGNGTLAVSSAVTVGGAGNGTMTLLSGGYVSAPSLNVGAGNGVGSVIINSGGTLSLANPIAIRNASTLKIDAGQVNAPGVGEVGGAISIINGGTLLNGATTALIAPNAADNALVNVGNAVSLSR